MKIVTVVGARPQFVKAAAVSRAIGLQGAAIHEVIVHTGQHFDENMSAIFFDEMDIPRPSYNLGINSLHHGAMTGRMIEAIEAILLSETPDAVLVYGDTNSTLAGALAAKKLLIPVVHVEAGLRSFNIQMPEEINRILTDRISDLLCCPTDTAVRNLQSEGISSGGYQRISNTGDVMLDAVMHYRAQALATSTILDRLPSLASGFVLCTIHRAENTDSPERLTDIMAALTSISRDTQVILPLHPRTRKRLKELRITASGQSSTVTIIEPVGYFDMLQLLESATAVITDSGGLQKEAFFFKRPCVTLRDETEWTELIDGGYNILAGSATMAIGAAYRQMLNAQPDFGTNLYGTGNASQTIINELLMLDTKQKKEFRRATT